MTHWLLDSGNRKAKIGRLQFEELFDLDSLQKTQDAFTLATGVASIITRPDGTPLTNPSGFCGLCTAIRKTEEGLEQCVKSHAILRKPNSDGPVIQTCPCGNMLIASASIIVNGQHIATWQIGQIIAVDRPPEVLSQYADRIGLDRREYLEELSRVNRMPAAQFENISRYLYLCACNLSGNAEQKLALEREIKRRHLRESVIRQLNERLMFDINERKRSEQALRQSEERYRCIFEEAPMGIGVFDLMTHQTLQVNEKYAETVGMTRSEMLRTDWADITHPDDMEKDNTDTEYLLNNPGIGIKRQKRYIRPDGNVVWANLTVVGLKSADGASSMEITMVEDITEQRHREERIRYLNHHDVLTGLHNRAYMEEARKRIEDSGILPASIIIGDINGLKLINDAFGHQAGDGLLTKIADILKRCCREDDVIARIGGDEFMILLPETDQETVRSICAKIKEACENFGEINETDLFLPSIALGSATRTTAGIPFERVIKDAEDIMYRKKLLDRKSMHSSLIASIKATMFEKSHETEAHAARLVRLSRKVGIELGLNANEMNSLDLLATLHDIGKISVDGYILQKPGKLTDEEWAEIRKHPEAGYRIAQASPELTEIAEYILCHHEHWNGGGYPQGLSGEDIPLLSRIISVVDAYDAMTQDRCYRKALPRESAIDEIRKNAGIQFDPRIAAIFTEKILPDYAAEDTELIEI